MSATVNDTKIVSFGPNGLTNPVNGRMRTELPATFTINNYTYHNGSGYTNTACRLVGLPANGSGNHYVAGTIHKKGDYNYTGQNVQMDFMFCVWSGSNSVYELKVRGVGICDTGSSVWVDTSGYLWWWNNNHWQQNSYLVIKEIVGTVDIDCATVDANQHNWTGQTRWNVAGHDSVHEREAAWGN